MKIKYIIIVMLLISLSTLFINVNNSFAVGSCNIELIADKTKVKPGETVTFELKASDINISGGIVEFNGYVDYDTDLFEECKIVPSTPWVNTMDYSALLEPEFYAGTEDLSQMFLLVNNSNPSLEDQVMAKISLKVKSNATVGKTEVTITSETDEGVLVVKGENGDEVKINDISSSLTIVESDSELDPDPDPQQDPDPEQEPDTKKNPTPDEELEDEEEEYEDDDDEVIEEPAKDMPKTTSSSDLPYAGVLGMGKILIVIAIIGFAILSYKKYNKWKKI